MGGRGEGLWIHLQTDFAINKLLTAFCSESMKLTVRVWSNHSADPSLANEEELMISLLKRHKARSTSLVAFPSRNITTHKDYTACHKPGDSDNYSKGRRRERSQGFLCWTIVSIKILCTLQHFTFLLKRNNIRIQTISPLVQLYKVLKNGRDSILEGKKVQRFVIPLSNSWISEEKNV